MYEKLGIAWEPYDFKVIDETEDAAHGIWRLSIRTRSAFFRNCLRTMAENNRRNKRGRSATGAAKIGAVAMRYARFAHNILQYAKLMAQPHDWAPEVPRSEWTKVCEDPGPAHGLALEGAVAVTLRDRKEFVPA